MSELVKLMGKLPGEEEWNGLESWHQQLVEDPTLMLGCYVVLDVKKVERDTDTGKVTAKMRVRQIEVLSEAGEASNAVRKVFEEAYHKRTGKTPLPFDEAAGGELPDSGEEL